MVLTAERISDDGENIFLRVRKPFDVKGEILVELDNGETITNAQRRKVFALLNCISADLGYTPVEVIKEMMKLYYLGYTGALRSAFSLSDCPKETASEFIGFLIDFCISNQIPCNEPLQSLCEDLERYMYSCLMGKRCACCGKKGELHHVTAIGAGRDRRKVYQIGMWVMPLCREHHTEMHKVENRQFYDKYHICPVKLTEKVGKVYRLTKKNLRKE